MAESPNPLPVRQIADGPWQVLVVFRNMWLDTETESDARDIAAAPVLEYETEHRTGAEFAVELDRTAEALEKYRMGFGARFFRRRAEEARAR